MRGKLAVVAGLLALVATPAVASVNYYLKIEGLSGAVSQGGKSISEPIEIQSFHLATLAAGIVAVGGANTSHPPSPMVIVRKVDKTSPLFAQCSLSWKSPSAMSLLHALTVRPWKFASMPAALSSPATIEPTSA